MADIASTMHNWLNRYPYKLTHTHLTAGEERSI